MKHLFESISIYIHRISNYSTVEVLVELLLIAAVVWWVMRFLRGTRGARLVKGLAVILTSMYLVIRLLPDGLGWDRIEFLYGKFLLFAFVGVVVAFQPELRRFLLQVGQTRWLRRADDDEVQTTVSMIVESSEYLSRNKIGALIALERSVQLGAITEIATTMDAQLSSRLLNSVFYPGSALHDLGVVIREGRIVAAGCQFPLAESGEVDASLGSRHRAALGLAKECDALVLVVSEETGRVSLACEGQLYLGLESASLREMMIGMLVPRKVAKRMAEKSGS